MAAGKKNVRMYRSNGNFTGIYGWDEKKQKYVPGTHVLCIEILQENLQEQIWNT